MPTTFRSVGPWYSTEEAAEIMDRTPGHVSRLCKNGEFTSNNGQLDSVKAGNNYLLHQEIVKRLPDNEFTLSDIANYYHRRLRVAVNRKNYAQKPRILGILAPEADDAYLQICMRAVSKR